jgi:hypothetical protein
MSDPTRNPDRAAHDAEPSRARRWWWLAAIIVAIAILLVLVMMMLRGDDDGGGHPGGPDRHSGQSGPAPAQVLDT